jgi:hypothetical protein
MTVTTLRTDPTLMGDLTLVATFRTLAGVIDHYRDVREAGSTAEQLLAWEAVNDGARDLAYTLLFDPALAVSPLPDDVAQLARTLVEQVRAPWDQA